MSSLFKKCPNCGRRFEVEHTGEKLEKTEVKTENITVFEPLQKPGAIVGANVQTIEVIPGPGAVAKETRVVATEEDTFQESFTCKHCGYSWTQKKVREKELGTPE